MVHESTSSDFRLFFLSFYVFLFKVCDVNTCSFGFNVAIIYSGIWTWIIQWLFIMAFTIWFWSSARHFFKVNTCVWLGNQFSKYFRYLISFSFSLSELCLFTAVLISNYAMEHWKRHKLVCIEFFRLKSMLNEIFNNNKNNKSANNKSTKQ